MGVIRQQDFAEPANSAQGGPQVVGDGVGERFEFLVGRLELRGAFSHPLLQFLVQPAAFQLRFLAGRDVNGNARQAEGLAGRIV